MKRNVISLLSVCLSILIRSHAQTIPNAGMENWDTINTWEDPTNWASTNIGNPLGLGINVFKSADAHTGDFALKLNQLLLSSADSNNLMYSIGEVSIGEMFKFLDQDILGTEDSEPALSCSNRPDSLVCWYKFVPAANSSNNAFGIKVILTKWNTTTNLHDTIGRINYVGTTVNSTYSRLSLPIEYVSNLVPDKINISLDAADSPDPIDGQPVVSNYLPSDGTYVLFDDLSFVNQNVNSIKENTVSKVLVYPNPADNIIYMSNLSESGYQLITMDGKIIERIKTSGSQEIQIVSSAYENGIYLVQTETGKTVGRFIISH
jgi:hypothetical protein